MHVVEVREFRFQNNNGPVSEIFTALQQFATQVALRSAACPG
jgi:hypothetical protein